VPRANENEPLFSSPEGHEIHYRNFIQRVFKKAAIKADLPNITFHDLRRTHATILIASGASQKVVQERLGHRSISTTLALYTQGTEQGHTDAANATAKYLRPEDDNIYLIRAD
jgi:integrase